MKISVWRRLLAGILASASFTQVGGAAELVFEDKFEGRLAEGWQWKRENPAGWRVTDSGLEVRMEPGNMWGPANNAKNVLWRPVPVWEDAMTRVTVTLRNRPVEQYEQADLVWYYSDGHMVKIGQEMVDGKLSLVMGREENDRARTICILPLQGDLVQVRYEVRGDHLRGLYRPEAKGEWLVGGSCDLPKIEGVPPMVSLQFYQGPKDVERWACATDFSIERIESQETP